MYERIYVGGSHFG